MTELNRVVAAKWIKKIIKATGWTTMEDIQKILSEVKLEHPEVGWDNKAENDVLGLITVQLSEALKTKLKEEMKKELKQNLPPVQDIVPTDLAVLLTGGGYRPTEQLIYEPIGQYRYLWRKGERKGIAIVAADDDDSENPTWLIDIDGVTYSFGDKEPIDTPQFYIPSIEKINQWVSGEQSSKPSEQVYYGIRKFYKVCLDLVDESQYDILTMLTLQSWMINLLDVVAYGNFKGGFGGGKSTGLEVQSLASRHGTLTSSLSASSMGRMIEAQQLSIFCDEYDAKKKNGDDDDEVDKIARNGYRRGAKYVRTNPKTLKQDISDPFGYKAFSTHFAQEQALSTRCLPVFMGESLDKRIAIINKEKRNIGQPVYDDIFFWMMDNLDKLNLNKVSWAQINFDNSEPEDLREIIYEQSLNGCTADERKFIELLRGRNQELAFILLGVVQAMGISEKVLASLAEAFRDKAEGEEEFAEEDYRGMVKQSLLAAYEEAKLLNNQKPLDKQELLLWVTNKAVYDKFLVEVESRKWKAVGNKRFRSYLSDFGVLDKVNYYKREIKELGEDGAEKKKSVRCIFFDERILTKLGIITLEGLSQLSQQSELSEFKEQVNTLENNSSKGVVDTQKAESKEITESPESSNISQAATVESDYIEENEEDE